MDLTSLTAVNSFPRNGRHFPDDSFKCIFINEKICTLILISLKFAPKGPVNNIPTMVQIMAWRRSGDKPLSDSMLTYFTDAYKTHNEMFDIANLPQP